MLGDLVLLHGFTQTGRSWSDVVANLGERYRAFCPDLPGHGAMATRRPATIGACVAYLRALSLPRFTLCGYSMGARPALRAALELPERVERLVLVSGSPGIADPGEREQRLKADLAFAERIESIPLEQFVDEWAAQPLFASVPRAAAAAARADRLRNEPQGLAAALRGMGQGATEPMWDRLGELRMPVALLAGAYDEKYVQIAAAVAERIPNCHLTVVPDAGHALHLERPHEVADAILG